MVYTGSHRSSLPGLLQNYKITNLGTSGWTHNFAPGVQRCDLLADSPACYRVSRKVSTTAHSNFSNVALVPPSVLPVSPMSPLWSCVRCAVSTSFGFPPVGMSLQLYFGSSLESSLSERQLKSQLHSVSLPWLFPVPAACQLLGFSKSPLESPLFVASIFLSLAFMPYKAQRPSETANPVNVLAAKPDNLNLLPRTHTVHRETRLQKVV